MDDAANTAQDNKLETLKAGLIEQFQAAGLEPEQKKQILRDLVAELWGKDMLPAYSYLDHAVIEHVRKASIGAAVALVFTDDDGIKKAVLAEAGPHYKDGQGNLMCLGGFINLTKTEGSSYISPRGGFPEYPQYGAARECEEELTDDRGVPIIALDPARLQPISTKAIMPLGHPTIVIGYRVELTRPEVLRIKEHIARLRGDEIYKSAVALKTQNPESGQPEIANIHIAAIEDLAGQNISLLYQDQKTLFQAIADFDRKYQIRADYAYRL